MPDPVLHHRLRPNVRVHVRGAELETNALGLRGRDVALQKAPETLRILMLGDSFTEGRGLALADTVATRVEEMLNRGPCHRRFEVVNGGVSSYSPILEYLFLKHVGLSLSPDLVILNFDMTDVHDDVVRTAIARLGPDGLPVAVPPNDGKEAALLMPPARALKFLDTVERLAMRSVLYRRLRTSAPGQRLLGSVRLTADRLEELGLVGNVQYDLDAITRDGDFPGMPEGWRLTERYLGAIHALARAHGIDFALVVYPHAQQVSPDAARDARSRFGLRPGLYPSQRPFEILGTFGQRAGFPVINLLHLFRERAGQEESLFWHDDIHHTPAGARVFAEGIVDGIRDRHLVPCVGTRS